jgi:hypothetical protein
LGLLDAFKDIKIIQDSSTSQIVRRLSAIVKNLNADQIALLIKYALVYPPRARALVGAILENIGIKERGMDDLKDSLNPLTKIKISVKETDLPTKTNWYIV